MFYISCIVKCISINYFDYLTVSHGQWQGAGGWCIELHLRRPPPPDGIPGSGGNPSSQPVRDAPLPQQRGHAALLRGARYSVHGNIFDLIFPNFQI